MFGLLDWEDKRTVTLKVYRDQKRIGRHKMRVRSLAVDFAALGLDDGTVISIDGYDHKGLPFHYGGPGLRFDIN